MATPQPFYEDRRVDSPVPPGPSLLSSFIERGRPVYRPAPGVAVPRLERVPAPEEFLVVPNELHRYRRAPEVVLRFRVASWLDQWEAQGSRAHALDADDLAQLRALAASALHDVAGLKQSAVKEWIGPPTVDGRRRTAILSGVPSTVHQGGTRSTGRQIARGRRLWVQLAAWPWWAIFDARGTVAGPLPTRWWEIPRVVETYRTWRLLRPDGSIA